MVGLFFAGWYSLSDDPKDQNVAYEQMKYVKDILLANTQLYLRYLHETVLKALDYEDFQILRDLAERKKRVSDLFSRYGIASSNNKSCSAIIKANEANSILRQYRPIFLKDEFQQLALFSNEIQAKAVRQRLFDMVIMTSKKAVETEGKLNEVKQQAGKTEKEFKTLKKTLKKDKIEANATASGLKKQIIAQGEQLAKLEEANKNLVERLAALESTKKQEEKDADGKETQEIVTNLQDQTNDLKKQLEQPKEEKAEEQSQLMGELKRAQKQGKKEVTKKQEESFVSTGHRKQGKFTFGSRWDYIGEFIVSEENTQAEGEGVFRLGALEIIGSFSHNRLDLSNATVGKEDLKVPFNTKGYFDLEHVKMILGSDVDVQKKQIIANMSDGSQYIFSNNKIEHVMNNGQTVDVMEELKAENEEQ